MACDSPSGSRPSRSSSGCYGRNRARRPDREPARHARAAGRGVREGGEQVPVRRRSPQRRRRRERQEHPGDDDPGGGVRLVDSHQDGWRGCGAGDGRAARARRRGLSRDASEAGSQGKGRRVSPADRLLKGIGVSPGIAMEPTVTVRWALPEVPHRVVPRTQVEKEVRRLRAALKDVREQLNELRVRAEARAGVDEARIFDAQLLMLDDKDFIGGVAELIRENHFTAEKAFEFKTLEVRDLWTAAGNPLLKERLADVTGVAIRVIQHLMHRGADDVWDEISQASIVVAHELSPGLTVQLDREHVVGLISEEGTRTAHAAILAHSLGIPAVMGAAGALASIPPGMMVLLDGQSGSIVLDPTRDELDDAKTQISRRH